MSERNKVGSRGLATASVPWFIAAMAIVTCMERATLPRSKDAGLPGPVSVTRGKKNGTYIGRVSIRATGYFNITTEQGTVQGISHRFCQRMHRCDGYNYQKGEAALSLNPSNGIGLHAALE
jgi:hypothetical protein